MTKQGMFDFQLKLLLDEIGEIRSKIALYDNLSFKIKGWSLTIWIGLLGFAINQKSPLLILIPIPVLVAFWLLDAHFKSYQQRTMVRMKHIESFLNKSIEGPVKNLAEAFEKRSFGSFIIPDPIGRQTCKADKNFKEECGKKTRFRRSLWIRNVRLLYLFLLGASIFAALLMYLLAAEGL